MCTPDRSYRYLKRRCQGVKDWNSPCCVCFDPVRGSDKAPLILACDHVLHVRCYAQHTLAYSQRVTTRKELEAVLEGGAPCPLCRCCEPFAYFRQIAKEDYRS